MKGIEEIIDCAKDISKYYDRLHEMNTRMEAANLGIIPQDQYDLYAHKKAAWLALIAVNGLESLRFYAAFATFFSFPENGMLSGAGKIIAMIARDEALHCALTSQLLNILPKEDPDFAQIRDETFQESADIYNDIVEQELEWVRFIFREGSLLGLNESILSDYVKHLSTLQMTKFGIPVAMHRFKGSNKSPLPWMRNYLNQNEVQSAPQETSIINYTTGETKDDLSTLEIGADFFL
jgi:ribonucleoside-diphosphate reductase beta chain